MNEKDTIIARATPVGESALAIVRLSGPDSLKIISSIFIPNNPEYLDGNFKANYLTLGSIIDPSTKGKIDICTIIVEKAPHTYTGEDTVEIICHGGGVVVGRVIEICLDKGARPAEPGEFTKRAFLNNKIDLTQAEAVCDVIRAKTDVALKFAMRNLNGEFSGQIKSLREILITTTAEIEARLDFPEDSIEEISDSQLLESLSNIKSNTQKLIDSGEKGKFFRDGAKIVITGKPNSGKSSLFNVLVGTERAIVTPHPGTTRDVIEVTLDVGGIPTTFFDTAGIRINPEEIESLGIEKAMNEIKNADIVLFLIDLSSEIDENDLKIFNDVRTKTHLILLNKVDIADCEQKEILSALGAGTSESYPLKISALKKIGIEELEKKIVEVLIGSDETHSAFSDESLFIANLRHIENLKRSEAAIEEAIKGIKEKRQLELIAVDLRDALSPLDEILGLNANESILEQIFNTFCIGK